MDALITLDVRRTLFKGFLPEKKVQSIRIDTQTLINVENVTVKCPGSAAPAESVINRVSDLKRESTACLLKK